MRFFTVVRAVILTSVCISVFADNTPRLTAAEPYPLAVAVNDDGVIFVADRNLPGIWKIEDGKTSLYFQGSKKFRTPLNAVRCLAIDAKGQLLVGDSATREVYRFDAAGKPQPLTKGRIGIPSSIAVDKDGNLFVADLETQRIWSVPAAGGEPKEFAVIAAVRGLAFNKDGVLFAVSTTKNQLQKFDDAGKATVVLPDRPFDFPHHLAIDEDGTAYVTDNYAEGVWKIPADGKPELWKKGEPLKRPVGLCRQGKGLLIADPHARAVFSLDADGTLKQLAGPKDFAAPAE